MNKKITTAIAIIVISSFGSVVAVTAASAATSKTITCYKGNLTKKVKAVSPKCPAGWSIKKPVAATPTKAAAQVVISATYKGTISALWSDSGIDASVKGVASTNNAGLDTLVGSGNYAAQEGAKCITLAGEANLSGGGNTLKLSFITPKSTACGKDADGPTSVEINGLAQIIGGTGKYVGATGTLKVEGTFKSAHPSNGVTEKVDLVLTLSGNIVTK
jgi:hypothetical protein